MIGRHQAAILRDASRKYPVLAVTGPRQSGKTTLVRATFPRHSYVSLELPDQRAYALEDPRRFLAQFAGPVILDEVQRAPELFSYIQVLSDENSSPRALCPDGLAELSSRREDLAELGWQSASELSAAAGERCSP